MADVPRDWLETALKVTGHFEDSADPLGAVTGNFDGMGVSLGVLQWNIGSGSLQPMVQAVGRDAVIQFMPTFGAELWNACGCPISQGLDICRGWHQNGALRANVRQELKAFTRSAAFLDRQLDKAAALARQAMDQAQVWSAADPRIAAATKALFCWFFDVLTQNGGLKGLTYADVDAFLNTHGAARADDLVCDWLSNRANTGAYWRDAEANAALWRNQIPDERLSIFVLSYLRAQKSRTEYRGDVLNRKATIAVGVGWVHREKHDLRALLA